MCLPSQGCTWQDCQYKAGGRGRLFAQQMISLKYSQLLSVLSYKQFDVEQLKLVIETLCLTAPVMKL